MSGPYVIATRTVPNWFVARPNVIDPSDNWDFRQTARLDQARTWGTAEEALEWITDLTVSQQRTLAHRGFEVRPIPFVELPSDEPVIEQQSHCIEEAG